MTKRRNLFCFIALWFVTAVGSWAQKPLNEHVPGRLLVQTTPGVDASAAEQALARAGARVHHRIDQIGVAVLEVPEQALDAVTKALESSGRFTFIERDFVAHGMATPNDPDFSQQWHLGKIQAASAWGLTTGSATIPIAILDSGADPTHPDLAPKLLPGWNFVTGTSNTADNGALGGHGTAVSGAAAAVTNNLTGVAGVGWNNTVLPLVVLDSTNYASYSNIASAINYAADHGARIISISIAGPTASSTLQSAVDYAWSKGAVIFAAAGNSGTSTPVYPAACNNVLAISATEPTDTLASFSDYGTWIDLSAPGDSILTTEKGGGYWSCYGTSLATPIAAAVGALALSANPSLTASQLVSLLEQNSDDLGTPGYDQYFGWGRVNAYKAVLAAKSLISTADTTPPTVNISAPSPTATVVGTVSVQGTATDNVGVMKIELDVDGTAVGTASSSPFSFSWNSTTASNSSHSLAVKAYDAANNVGSAVVMVNVSNALPDTTPPTVNISAPTSGATVAGTISVQGTATDNVGVTKIELDVDGAAVATATASPFSFSWNSTAKPNGSHTLTIKAYDAANNVGSASVSVMVNNPTQATVLDTTPPVVVITQPVSGSPVSRNVGITVSATDNVGVARVSIYLDNIQLCNDTLAPYTCSWNTRKSATGTHTITATAWDAAGNAGNASPVTVTLTK
ncbi:MAG TPA: Ig-like domain-containing protein [Bryobacteraceae bacterium]|nr:Ig-like domain-containing protein [Bryobacteraceae bacterium]